MSRSRKGARISASSPPAAPTNGSSDIISGAHIYNVCSGNKIIMPPRAQRVPPDAYNGNTGQHADGADATATRPGCGGRFAARPALTATTAAAAPARSAGGEATPGLERR